MEIYTGADDASPTRGTHQAQRAFRDRPGLTVAVTSAVKWPNGRSDVRRYDSDLVGRTGFEPVTSSVVREIPGVCHSRTESNGEPLTCEGHSEWVALGPGTAEHVGSHLWLSRLWRAERSAPPRHDGAALQVVPVIIPLRRLRRLREGDVLEDGEVVLVCGGDPRSGRPARMRRAATAVT
jgi:hypothetical protein